MNMNGRPARGAGTADIATPVLVAKLFHQEGWSHRRIAEFLGWLKPSDDWFDPKVQAKTTQRVRRWVREGEVKATASAAHPRQLATAEQRATFASRPEEV
jgi:hypothetical protein